MDVPYFLLKDIDSLLSALDIMFCNQDDRGQFSRDHFVSLFRDIHRTVTTERSVASSHRKLCYGVKSVCYGKALNHNCTILTGSCQLQILISPWKCAVDRVTDCSVHHIFFWLLILSPSSPFTADAVFLWPWALVPPESLPDYCCQNLLSRQQLLEAHQTVLKFPVV